VIGDPDVDLRPKRFVMTTPQDENIARNYYICTKTTKNWENKKFSGYILKKRNIYYKA
jgi:hypothetical protein